MTPERTSIRGVDLAWELSAATGSQAPFVWAHGGNSSRAEEDRFAVLDFGALRSARSVLRYDARAHGESGVTENPDGYRWDELARDQLALAEIAGFDRYVAGGASLGAATALFAATLAPERIAGLVIATPPTGWEERDSGQDFYLTLADIVERDGLGPIIEGAASATLPDPLVGQTRLNEIRAEAVTRLDPRRLATFYRGVGTSRANMPSRELVSQIEAPTLILAWAGDPVHPLAAASELSQLIPDATLEVASTWEDFQRWTVLTTDFLAAIEGR